MRRLTTLLALAAPTVLVVLYGAGWEPGPDRVYLTLREFVGRDRWTLAPRERLRLERALSRGEFGLDIPDPTFAERLRAALDPGFVWEPSLWTFCVARIDDWPPDGVGIVVPDGDPFHPWERTVRLCLRTRGGETTTALCGGERLAADPPLVLREETPLGVPLYVAEYNVRQYYARSGSRFVLVRLENLFDGDLMRNAFGREDLRPYGPPFRERTHEEWLAGLDSSDPVEVLEALTWLTAERPVEDRKPNLYWWELPETEAVRGRLERLCDSERPWIAEAARAALFPAGVRAYALTNR